MTTGTRRLRDALSPSSSVCRSWRERTTARSFGSQSGERACSLPNHVRRAGRADGQAFRPPRRGFVRTIHAARKVYVNALRGSWPDRAEPILVCDGGTIAWGVVHDVERGELSDFSFNGSLLPGAWRNKGPKVVP